MPVARAWIVAALVTVIVVALVLGVGSTTGQFGFRGESSFDSTGGAGDGPFVESASADDEPYGEDSWDDDDDDDDDDDEDAGREEHEDDDDD